MPTYEYVCRSCGEHVEVVQSFKDDPLSTCPNCEGELRKVFGAIGIAFKGSGFYRTDSRPAPKEKAESGDGAKAKEGKADAKSGSAGESKTGKTDSTSAASS